MAAKNEIKDVSISIDNITSKIFIIRGEKVMLDRDLAVAIRCANKKPETGCAQEH